ncbi:MAG: GAF domain-containing protein, partial [Anaerolineales bacterium]
MSSTNSAAYADRVTLLFRWLGILLLTMLLGGDSGLTSIDILLLILLSVWNLVLSVFSVLFLLFSRYHGAPFLWAGLIPIFTGALYYLLRGGLITTGAEVLVSGIVLTVTMGAGRGLSLLAFPAVVMGFLGVVLGMLSQQWGYYTKQRRAFEQTKTDEAERRERERIKALYKITSTMTATLNYQKVLDMSLDLTANVLADKENDNQIVSAALLFYDDDLYVRSARRFTPMDHRVILPAEEGVLYESIRSGQPRKLVNPQSDPELNKLVAIRNCGVVYCYPLRTAKDIFGVLVFGHPDETYFNDLRCEILEIIGRQAFV